MGDGESEERGFDHADDASVSEDAEDADEDANEDADDDADDHASTENSPDLEEYVRSIEVPGLGSVPVAPVSVAPSTVGSLGSVPIAPQTMGRSMPYASFYNPV